jgi:phosphate transport system protein
MGSQQAHRHIVRSFDEQIAKLRSLMLEMGGLVEDQVRRAQEALFSGNVEAAREVIARDHIVNGLEVRIDEEIVSMLALRQPMGGDLRTIVSIAKAVTDLERIGDEAEKIGRMTVHMYSDDLAPPKKRLLRNVKKMSKTASEILRDSLDSFARLDVEKAIATARLDTELDQEFQTALRELMTYIMEDSRIIGQAMKIVWVIKALERIGDHSKNIGEYAIYLVKGKDVRHVSPDALDKDILEEGR